MKQRGGLGGCGGVEMVDTVAKKGLSEKVTLE